MSVLACNLQTTALSDQQELRKAAFKLVYGWSMEPALWAQSLTHSFWCQKIDALLLRTPVVYNPDDIWELTPTNLDEFLARRYGVARNVYVYCDMFTDPISYTWTLSISSKSSVATLAEGEHFAQPDSKRLKLTTPGHFAHAVFLQPDEYRD